MESTVLQCTLGSLVSSHLLTDFQTVNSDLYLIPILSKNLLSLSVQRRRWVILPKNLWNSYRRKSMGWRKYSWMRFHFPEEKVMFSSSPQVLLWGVESAGSSHSSQATKNFLSSMKWARHSRRGKWREKRSLLVLLAGNNWKTSLLFLSLTTLVGK